MSQSKIKSVIFPLLFLLVMTGISTQSRSEIRVAITVDDLPITGASSSKISRQMIFDKILTVFQEHNIPPSYGFINANKLEHLPRGKNMLWQWVNAGHLLANHGYSHLSLTKSNSTDFINDITKNESVLSELMGTKNFKYFRYPFLDEGDSLNKRNTVREHLQSRGYQIAQVTIDWEDWAWNDPFVRCLSQDNQKEIETLKKSYIHFSLSRLNRAQQISKTLFKRDIPHILLVHIGAANAEFMDTLLDAYEKAGVRFITLDEAIKDPVYQIDPAWTATHGDNFLDQIMLSRKLKFAKEFQRVPVNEIAKTCLATNPL